MTRQRAIPMTILVITIAMCCAHSSGVYAQVATGACCNAEGTCANGVTSINCVFSGGLFQGDGSTCGNVNCTGACCASSTCTAGQTKASCQSESTYARFLGPKTTCSGVTCTGACCKGLVFGCSDGNPVSCAEALVPGTFAGLGSSCAAGGCRGACCGQGWGGTCEITSRNGCSGELGNFQGLGSTCDDCRGACCLEDGTCWDGAYKSGCPGHFQGRATQCGICEPAGGCCFGNDGCDILTEATCDGSGGNYLGDGSTCESCLRACCIGQGGCVEQVSLTTCQDVLHGLAAALGSTCQSACKGACCIEDDVCIDGTSQFSCGEVQGLYQGAGSSCEDGACPFIQCPGTGGCCECNSTAGCESTACCTAVCENLPWCCSYEWDDFCRAAANTLCDGYCTEEGGCCLPNGTCAIRSATDCEAQDGHWRGGGSTCAFAICDFGACCYENGTCDENTTTITCAFRGGSYLGNDSTCSPTRCPDCPGGGGHCCEENGTPGCVNEDCCGQVCAAYPYCCEDGWDADCGAKAESICESYCLIRGGCCLPDATCQENLTEADCEAAEGIWRGSGSNCTLANCQFGACCENGGTCADGQNQLTCTGSFGVFQGHASRCEDQSCPGCAGDGACCEANGTPGCDDIVCCRAVSNIAPSCGSEEWTEDCAAIATILCDSVDELFCFGCPGEGNCCEGNGSAGCEKDACCESVCEIDPTCCLIEWESVCANLAKQVCDDVCEQPPSGDLDGDDDVDMSDYKIIQESFTGPQAR